MNDNAKTIVALEGTILHVAPKEFPWGDVGQQIFMELHDGRKVNVDSNCSFKFAARMWVVIWALITPGHSREFLSVERVRFAAGGANRVYTVYTIAPNGGVLTTVGRYDTAAEADGALARLARTGVDARVAKDYVPLADGEYGIEFA